MVHFELLISRCCFHSSMYLNIDSVVDFALQNHCFCFGWSVFLLSCILQFFQMRDTFLKTLFAMVANGFLYYRECVGLVVLFGSPKVS